MQSLVSRRNPTLSRWNLISLSVAFLVLLSAIGGVGIGSAAVSLFQDLRHDWEQFDTVSEQKISYLIDMHRHLGYSGLAQHWGTYVLYGDKQLLNRIDIDLDQAQNAINSYRLLAINDSERLALRDLDDLVRHSRVQVHEITKFHEAGLSPSEIDKRVSMEPNTAVSALDQLRWAWREQAKETENAIYASSRAGTELINYGWVFIPIMLGIGLVVFALVNRLCKQIAAYEREKEALEQSERKFRDMAANVPGVIFQWYERHDGDRGYLYVSPRCQELYGVSAEELQRNWQALSMHPDDEERYLQTVQEAFENQTDWSFEGRFLTPSGEEKWWRGVSKPVPVDDQKMVFNGVIIDISLQKKLEEELRTMATTDGLTNTLNRRHFTFCANQELDRATRYKSHLCAIIFDLDHFKNVNDTFGHSGGDEVLRQFADTVRHNLRASDIFGRIGGEEFALILPETNVDGATVLAERIRKDVQNLNIRWDKRTINVTVSVGVSVFDETDKDITALLERADKALYVAKSEGRNQVMISGLTNRPTKSATDATDATELLELSSTKPGPHGVN